MHAQRRLAFGILEDFNGVVGISVDGGHDVSRIVGADGDQAEVERAAEFTDLTEGGTGWEVWVRAVGVFGRGGGDRAVACVSVGEIKGKHLVVDVL